MCDIPLFVGCSIDIADFSGSRELFDRKAEPVGVMGGDEVLCGS